MPAQSRERWRATDEESLPRALQAQAAHHATDACRYTNAPDATGNLSLRVALAARGPRSPWSPQLTPFLGGSALPAFAGPPAGRCSGSAHRSQASELHALADPPAEGARRQRHATPAPLWPCSGVHLRSAAACNPLSRSLRLDAKAVGMMSMGLADRCGGGPAP